jgi:hypothetical protein
MVFPSKPLQTTDHTHNNVRMRSHRQAVWVRWKWMSTGMQGGPGRRFFRTDVARVRHVSVHDSTVPPLRVYCNIQRSVSTIGAARRPGVSLAPQQDPAGTGGRSDCCSASLHLARAVHAGASMPHTNPSCWEHARHEMLRTPRAAAVVNVWVCSLKILNSLGHNADQAAFRRFQRQSCWCC